MVKQAHKKMLNTTDPQVNASQNLSEYDLATLRRVIIKKTNNDKCWPRADEKATLPHFWWECKLVQPLWKAVWSFLTEIGPPYDPAISLLGIYLKKIKALIQKIVFYWYRNRYTDQWSRMSPEINPCICGTLIYDKGSKNIQWRKDSLFNKWCLHKRAPTCQRINKYHYLILYTKPTQNALKT